jgi:hypothetical protein
MYTYKSHGYILCNPFLTELGQDPVTGDPVSTYCSGCKHIQLAASSFCNGDTQRWILRPKGISEQAEKVSVEEEGQTGGYGSRGVDLKIGTKGFA